MARVLAATVAGLFVGAFVVGTTPGSPRCGFESRVDVAKLAVARYANEAYQAWQARHPGQTCPSGLDELRRNAKLDARDPWGRYYQFTCGVDRIHVMSLGPDNLLGTDDDIWNDAYGRR